MSFAYRSLLVRRRVVVNMPGRAFEGVLYAQRGPLIVLRDVSLHENGNTVRVDGTVVIERDRIDFIQAVT